MNSLVEFWRDFEFNKRPYIHPKDSQKFGKTPQFSGERISGHRAFIKSERFRPSDRGFHLSILPVPYVGNLSKADIFVLLLNPGFALSSYQTEEDAAHRKLLVKTIKQDFRGTEFPFLSLNPEMAWTTGFQWWHRKLLGVIDVIAESRRKSHLWAMRDLSKRLAAIEMVPYRSKSFSANKLVSELPSAIAARNYVRGELLPRAKSGELTIIVLRKVKEWNLPRAHAVIYEGGSSRGAHLSVNSSGGKAILRRYGIK